MAFTDLNSSEYQIYLQDIATETLGQDAGTLYLPNLLDWLPNFNYQTSRILDVGASIFSTYNWFDEKFGNHIDGFELATFALNYQVHPFQGQCSWNQDKIARFKCPVDAHRMLEHYQSSTYDMVISFHALEHMFDVPLVLHNIYEVLRSGGYFYFSLPAPSANFHRGHWYEITDLSFVEGLCRQASFQILKSEHLWDLRYRPQPEIIGLARKA